MREKIDRYEIKQEIGRGGMATVYFARDTRMDRDVAVKVLLREMLTAPDVRERFQREAKVIATLDHPAIVPVYEFGEDDGDPYIVMRYMSGGSLSAMLKKIGKVSLPDAAIIVDRVASALDRAHTSGVIHRDLKPGNILFDQYDNAFLADFGIVKLVQSVTGITQEGTFFGTPHYMSPEQVIGQVEIDGRSDVYALGVILYEMLTGRAPFHADTPLALAFKHVYEDIPEVLHVTPDLPPEISRILEKALAKDRDHRYATAGQLSSELLQIAGVEVADLVRRTGGLSRGDAMLRAPEPEAEAAAPASAAAPADPHNPDFSTKRLPLGANGDPVEAAVPASAAAAHADAAPPAASAPVPAPARPDASGGDDRTIPTWVLVLGGTALVVIIGLLAMNSLFAGDPPVVGDEPTPTEELTEAETDEAPTETEEPGEDEPTPRATQEGNVPIVPSGARIAFVAGLEQNEAYDIFVMNADGTERTRLTYTAEGNRGPVWSPDGTRLAFRAKVDGVRTIFVMNADGSDVTALTDDESENYSPAWSPDGEQIAFVSERDGDPEIYVMDANGDNQVRLTDNEARNFFPAWSPDGERILFYTTLNGKQDLYVMDADGSRQLRLTSDPANDFQGAWSPDGEQIAFVSERNGDPEIFLMNADGTDQTALTENTVADVYPSWSPEGRYLVFATNRDGNFELYRLDIESLDVERLSDTPEADIEPAWQP